MPLEYMKITAVYLNSIAKSLIGVPYKYYGRDLKGLDCFGLVITFFDLIGLKIADPVHYDPDWWSSHDYMTQYATTNFFQVESPQCGDVLLVCVRESKVPNHAAIYLDNKFILNVDQIVGTHLLYYYAIKNIVAGVYRCRDVELVA